MARDVLAHAYLPYANPQGGRSNRRALIVLHVSISVLDFFLLAERTSGPNEGRASYYLPNPIFP